MLSARGTYRLTEARLAQGMWCKAICGLHTHHFLWRTHGTPCVHAPLPSLTHPLSGSVEGLLTLTTLPRGTPSPMRLVLQTDGIRGGRCGTIVLRHVHLNARSTRPRTNSHPANSSSRYQDWTKNERLAIIEQKSDKYWQEEYEISSQTLQ